MQHDEDTYSRHPRRSMHMFPAAVAFQFSLADGIGLLTFIWGPPKTCKATSPGGLGSGISAISNIDQGGPDPVHFFWCRRNLGSVSATWSGEGAACLLACGCIQLPTIWFSKIVVSVLEPEIVEDPLNLGGSG